MPTALLEPKVARTFTTFTVETGVSLRTRFVYIQGLSESRENSYYHNVMYPLQQIKGLTRPSINDAGVVRYTIERSNKVNQDVIHEQVRQIILAALAKLNTKPAPI